MMEIVVDKKHFVKLNRKESLLLFQWSLMDVMSRIAQFAGSM